MTLLADVLGIHFFEVTFCVSFLWLMYTASCQLVIQSFFVFALVIANYRFIRNNGAKKLSAEGRYVLITGCDSGIGNALARRLDGLGMNVFATCLSENSHGAEVLKKTGTKHMCVMQMDVTSDESVASCLQKVKGVCAKQGLWTVVNNAGIDQRAECEIQTLAIYKKIAEVNLFGIVRVCKAFLPLVRKTKGRVVNVTSVQGLQAYPRISAYGASKFAAEGFSDCLRLEMRRFGVKVIIVEPGKFGSVTGMFSEELVQKREQVYRECIEILSDEVREAYGQKYLNYYLKINQRQKADATDKDIEDVLNAVEDAVFSTCPHSRYLVAGHESWIDDACIMARLNQILPAFLMDRIYLWRRPLPADLLKCTEM